jgi:hypothetical protein
MANFEFQVRVARGLYGCIVCCIPTLVVSVLEYYTTNAVLDVFTGAISRALTYSDTLTREVGTKKCLVKLLHTMPPVAVSKSHS